MGLKSLLNLAYIFIFLIAASTYAFAAVDVGIQNVFVGELSPEYPGDNFPEPGEEFEVNVTIKNYGDESTDGTIVLYSGDEQKDSWGTFTLNAGETFSHQFTLVHNECGIYYIHAKIVMNRNTQLHNQEFSVPVKIGKVFNVTITPEKAVVNRPVQVDVKNDFGLAAEGAKIWVTNKYGILNKMGDVQENDIFSFTPDFPTEFIINVTTKDVSYCGYSKMIEARHNLTVYGPYSDRYPDEPIAGDEMIVKVNDEDGKSVPGAAVTLIGPERIDLNTDRFGGSVFNINKGGEYHVTIEKTTPLHWSVNKTIYVHAKPTIKFTASPEKPSLGKDIKIKILNENASEANITIINPEGFTMKLKVNENNEAVFNARSLGTYTVSIDHECCTTAVKQIEIYNSLKILIEPKKPAVGDNITIIVVNQDGYPVPGATLTIKGKDEFTGTADQIGELKFKLTSGDYTITAEKKDYKKATAEISAYVRELSLNLSAQKLRIYEGDVRISVFEKDTGTPAYAKITITGEGTGVKIEENASDFTFKPEFADRYRVSAALEYYKGSEEMIIIDPVPLEVSTSLNEKNLTIKVTSEGKPLPYANVSVVTPKSKLITVTDSNGFVTVNLDVEGDGYYSILASNPPNYNSAEAAVKVIRNQHYWWAWLILIIILAVAVILRRF